MRRCSIRRKATNTSKPSAGNRSVPLLFRFCSSPLPTEEREGTEKEEGKEEEEEKEEGKKQSEDNEEKGEEKEEENEEKRRRMWLLRALFFSAFCIFSRYTYKYIYIYCNGC